jgi:hypothetical protein
LSKAINNIIMMIQQYYNSLEIFYFTQIWTVFFFVCWSNILNNQLFSWQIIILLLKIFIQNGTFFHRYFRYFLLYLQNKNITTCNIWADLKILMFLLLYF